MKPTEATVFVIEDHAANLRLFEGVLLQEVEIGKYRAQASGQGFFRWINDHPDDIPHVILLDIQIPREDGFTVLQKIRADNRFLKTRIIAITADITTPNINRAEEAGFDGFIGKPIRIDKFPDQIQRILEGERIWEPR